MIKLSDVSCFRNKTKLFFLTILPFVFILYIKNYFHIDRIENIKIPKKYFFCIFSKHEHHLKRNEVRSIWMNHTLVKRYDFTYKFFIGKPLNNDFSSINHEILLYNDIVLLPFNETFRMLTHKIMESINWFLSNSYKYPDVKYFIKMDDDFFLFANNLLNYLNVNNVQYFGLSAGNLFPDRDSSSKYYLSKEEYPSETFKPYILGPCVVINKDSLIKMYETSKKIKYFHNDDVYIGLLAAESGISLLTDERFSLTQLSYDKSLKDICSQKDIFGFHISSHLSYDDKLKFFNLVSNFKSIC